PMWHRGATARAGLCRQAPPLDCRGRAARPARTGPTPGGLPPPPPHGRTARRGAREAAPTPRSSPGEGRRSPRAGWMRRSEGSAARGTRPTHPIHAVTAFCHDLAGVLAQLVVDAKQHEAELTVAPDAIRQIDWQGRVLTGDALYCQQALCTQVVEAGGDYLLLVKESQPTLLAEIVQLF